MGKEKYINAIKYINIMKDIKLLLLPLLLIMIIGCVSGADINITNCTELQDMNLDLNSNYFLINNIDCSDTINWDEGYGFKPIGNYSSAFYGNLSGNGFNITNLYINTRIASGIYGGLIGAGFEGIYKDLGIINASINTSRISGILAGTTADVSIYNVYVQGVINSSNAAAGLVGTYYNANRDQLYVINNTVEVILIARNTTSGTTYRGGLFAASGCAYQSTNTSYRIYGGILLDKNRVVTSKIDGDYKNGEAIGGLVGSLILNRCNGSYIINNSYANTEINGSLAIGGFVGQITVLRNNFTISNSYATGRINYNGQSTIDPSGYGGFIGYFIIGSAQLTKVENCFSDVRIESNYTDNVGQIIGLGRNYTILNTYYYSYNNLNCTGNFGGEAEVNCTAYPDNSYFLGSDSKDNAPMTSWDFDNIWKTTSSYPDFKEYIQKKINENKCKNKKCKKGIKIGTGLGIIKDKEFIQKIEHKIIIGKPIGLSEQESIIVLKGGVKLR